MMARLERQEKYRTSGGASCTSTAVVMIMVLLNMISMAMTIHGAATTVGYYDHSCPDAEAIILRVVKARFAQNPTITAALLRMFFHDCFVRGCDASNLLDSTPGNVAEKESVPNQTLRELNLIDQIKAALEQACPHTVSCADIIAYATRDSVWLSGGPKYVVGGGRRDGRISRIEDVNVPGPSFSVDLASESFAQKGLSLNEMVTLLGAHTTGFAHCAFFSDRVFDFQGTGQPDPAMNKTLVQKLARVCRPDGGAQGGFGPVVALDQGTRDAFDSSFFSQLKMGNGILQIDQELTGDARTLPLVNSFTSPATFFPAFVQAILKMGNIGIKTTSLEGEIRTNCHRVNPNTTTTAATPPPPPPPKTTPPPPPPNTKPPSPPKRAPSPPHYKHSSRHYKRSSPRYKHYKRSYPKNTHHH